MQFETGLLFIDGNGQPFDDRLQHALRSLMPRFRRTFPQMRDEAVVSNVVEEAASRVVEREKRRGPIPELSSYLWTALKHAAISYFRKSHARVEVGTVSGHEPERPSRPASNGRNGLQDLELSVLCSQALEQMTDAERQIAIRKMAGFSAVEIGAELSRSPAAVHTAYSRMCDRLRGLLAHSAKIETRERVEQ